MKKILFCMNHIKMGGIEKILCAYLLALKQEKTEVSVFCKEKIKDAYFVDFFKQNNICVKDDFKNYKDTKARSFIFKHLINNVEKFIYLNKIKNRLNKYDVIIDFSNLSWSKELKNCKKKKIGWIHGSVLFFKSANLIKKIKKTKYHQIMCLSQSFKNDLLEEHPFLYKKLNVIYNYINKDEIVRLSCEKDEFKPERPYFVAIQRLDKNDKDVETIIRAFELFQSKKENIHLYIVGDGPDKEDLINFSKNNKNIIFLGQLNNPYPLLKNAKALILSSRKSLGEGLPNVLLESQMLGVCCVAADVKSGVNEILMDGKAGLLFDAENSSELAEKMMLIVDDDSKVQKLIETATKNINRFSKENTIDVFKKLIETKAD